MIKKAVKSSLVEILYTISGGEEVLEINKTIKLKRVLSAILIIVCLCNCYPNIMTAKATVINETSSNESSVASNEVLNDVEELENFCDDFFSKYMKEDNVPGAVVSVVKNGEILIEKGYGYADIENNVVIDSKKTAFNICSIGKLFTGTAVMQLYEQGKIKSLGEDVNSYMDSIKVSNKYAKAVTFESLLTHTSGLDDGSVIGGAAETKKDKLSYENYLRKKLTPVLWEPGSITRYSNLGYDLLGYLVQEISGTSFEDYINENILQQLGMTYSTAGEIPKNTATPYIFNGSTLKPSINKIYWPGLGEACIYSTADDMAKFMIAHLQNGSYMSKSILKEETAKLMHMQHSTNNSALPGMCYTFLESYENNQHAIKHEGGDASGYVTTLYLLPEQNIGFFVAVNSNSALPVSFEREFLDHYFPCEITEPKASLDADRKENSEYEGTYRSYDDTSLTTFLKVTALFGDNDITVSNNSDGTLSLNGISFEGLPIATKLIQTGNLLFERADDNSYIAFKEDGNGNIAYAYNDEPQKTFEKIQWYESQSFNLFLLAVCLLVFIANIIGMSVLFIKRKRRKVSQSFSKLESFSNSATFYVSLLIVISSILFLVMLMSMDYRIQYGLTFIGYLSLGGLLLGAILSTVVIAFCIALWMKRQKSLMGRIAYTVSAISCIAFVWFLNYWNLLGFRL
ncbi:MAG: serine hydrolase domain-containing protein [Aminipila sp.]